MFRHFNQIKALVTTAADDILKVLYYSEKIRLAISCDSHGMQHHIFLEK